MKSILKEQYENDMELIFQALSMIMDRLRVKPKPTETRFIKAIRSKAYKIEEGVGGN